MRGRERARTITKKQDVTDEDPAQGERERDDDDQKKQGKAEEASFYTGWWAL